MKRTLILSSLVVVAGGCAPKTPPRTVTELTPPPAAALPSPAAIPLPAEPAPVPTPPLTVIIDDPAPEAEGPSLLEASRLAQERKKNAGPPIAIITNQNLAEYAKKGTLIIAPSKGEAGDPKAAVPESAEGSTGELHDETYWREGVRRRRERWREAVDEKAELEQRAASLRQQFYAEEDPYYRDSRIKPAWDRTLDRIVEVNRQISEARDDLDAFLEEGRRSDALPGWLREGIDLEPEANLAEGDARPTPATTDPREPTVVQEPPPR